MIPGSIRPLLTVSALLLGAGAANAQSERVLAALRAISVSPPTIAVTDVTVIDVAQGTRLLHRTVLINGTRITAVGPARSLSRTIARRVVDGRGKFLIPGMWDMHVHSGGYEHGHRYMPGMLAYGITGVRDMGSPLEDALRLRNETRSGRLVGPHMLVAGPLLNGPLPFKTPLIRSVGSETEGRLVVDSLQAAGVDFLKVHDALPRGLTPLEALRTATLAPTIFLRATDSLGALGAANSPILSC